MPPVPTRKEWQALKKKYAVPDAAVKGVSVGDALDKYKKRVESGDRVAADQLEDILKRYIAKIDKSKIKKFPQFKYEFDHQLLHPVESYVGYAPFGADSPEAWQKSWQAFIKAVQALNDLEAIGQEKAVARSRELMNVLETLPLRNDFEEVSKRASGVKRAAENLYAAALDARAWPDPETGLAVKSVRKKAGELADELKHWKMIR